MQDIQYAVLLHFRILPAITHNMKDSQMEFFFCVCEKKQGKSRKDDADGPGLVVELLQV